MFNLAFTVAVCVVLLSKPFLSGRREARETLSFFYLIMLAKIPSIIATPILTALCAIR
jgi:hypothetical protein